MATDVTELSAGAQRRIHEAAITYHESMVNRHRNMLKMLLKHEAGDVSVMSDKSIDSLLDDISDKHLDLSRPDPWDGPQ